ncbi:AAA family ATPase [Pseudonocardia adelaidensis]|uniref:AAA family ATPase n=1 Tax=Pseudonocardia adelaidensis TaxID=648754 RepID=A0ABP9NJG9_9PSEU
MALGRAVPGRDPSARADVLHQSERTRVTRLYLPGHTVVRKQPLGPDAERRLRHERAVLEQLRGVAGVAQLVEEPRYAASIVLADVGGTRPAKPLTVDALIRLGLGLARAVAAMHRRGVMHRDITPANIVLSLDGTPCLVDFALATSIAELRPEFTPRSQIVGTLAYLAPEQTGRTGRPVDQRADLYALGATLYELATGAPPFGSDDPLRLTHDHLARVPVPPADVEPAVPAPLSEIIMHLLEKEPDNRYQTAEGLVYDLERLRDARSDPAAAPPRVGERDFPPRLLPPSRLVGRDAEVAALQAAFEDALAGRGRGVLVAGAPGVGKTALVDQLRPYVAGRDGWFVAGKFDQYRRGLEFDGVNQAFRALGRLLLAEPEEELAHIRERIFDAVGRNAGLLAAVVPEFAALLAVPTDPGDPLTAQVRTQRSGIQVLRAVASPDRPVALFVDDLQWAGRTPLGFVDLVLDEVQIEGLFVVGAYRDDDVNAAGPLAALRSHPAERAGVRHLRLHNLRVASLVDMVAEMLHADRAAVVALVEAVAAHTSGNPYETVELLGALRRAGVLTPMADGWRWDATELHAYLSRSEVAGLLGAPVSAIPPASRQLVEAMACLGGRVEVGVLQTATGEPARVVEGRLAPALDEGFLVVEPGVDEAVRFRHDRIREGVLRGMDPRRRRTAQLTMARRLAEVPGLFAIAAEQYLPVVDAIDAPAERRRVVELLRSAADQARTVGDHALVDALLAAALRLVDPAETGRRVELHTGRHAALYSLGRLDEADEEYRTIDRLCTSAVQRVAATCLQVRSLTHRKRFADAIGLGLESLRDCGIAVPEADRLTAGLDGQFDRLHRWLDQAGAADDLARPEITEPRLLAGARLINVVLSPAYFLPDLDTFAWLSLEAVGIWLEHGPSRSLLGPVGHVGLAAAALRGDYSVGHSAMRRVLPLGEARGYEPETSHARFLFALLAWSFEPIEVGVQEFRRARDGLIAGGDLANAGYSYDTAVQYLGDCAPTLDSFVAEVEAGLAFLPRTGNEQTAQALDRYRWLAGVLRGEPAAAARAGDPAHRYADNPLALLLTHVTRAVAAAVFDDPLGLVQHTEAATSLLPAAQVTYPAAVVRLLRGLALAGQARAAGGGERGALLSELDEVVRWLAARAADAPDNFLHQLRLIEAEQAWAVGDFRAAALAFDMARREARGGQRPWHRALIAERAARFYLAHGVEQPGYDQLARAREYYAAWGATAKVAQLDWAYPTLRPGSETTAGPGGVAPADVLRHRSTVMTGALDLLGILSASQALSSETSVERLHSRVAEVLRAMTGATDVHLLLWSDDRQDWLLPAQDDSGPARAAPASVLHYVRRTGEPLVVDDSTRDDRFARDPYFAGLPSCALLAVPILGRGTLRAVLLLENRLIRAAFTNERLDAVTLIAGQLAVSLDNAQLYAELTESRARLVAAADRARRRIERDLHDGAQQRLISLAMQVGVAKAAVPPESAELAARLDDLAAEAGGALAALRELARGIHPADLVDGGLLPAFKALARRSTVPVRLAVQADQRLPEQVEIAAYYVVAEALTNTAKHAHASVVIVAAEADDAVLRVCVRDDGRGGADLGGGSGLVGLKDRVEALGGRLSLQTAPRTGTTVQAELPLRPARTVHG